MKYRLLFSKEAELDLDEAFSYIFQSLNAPKAAHSFMTRIERAITQLQEQPNMCPLFQEETLREMQYRKLVVENYIVVYWVDEKNCAVMIVRVFYGKQNYVRFIK